MWQIDLKIAGAFPSPALPSSDPKMSFSPTLIAEDIAINERAVYLPSPVFLAETEKIKNKLISKLTLFVVSVNVEIDKEGSVRVANVDSSSYEELLPAIIESAKKSKFVPA